MSQLTIFDIPPQPTSLPEPKVEPKIEPKPTKKDIRADVLKYATNWQPKEKLLDLDLTEVQKKTYHGWLLPYLGQTESLITGRWEFWAKANQVKQSSFVEYLRHGLSDKFLEESLYCHEYPSIDFSEQQKVLDYLYSILSLITKHGASLQSATNYFVDWLLYGFGHEEVKERPKLDIRKNVEVQLYQYVDLFPFLYHSADYFNPVMAEVFPMKQNKEKGFFPTPMTICQLMNQITNPENKVSIDTMNEPCSGTGSLVLAYSNSGGMCVSTTELQELVAKSSLVNYYLYCPQYARPIWYLIDRNEILWGNSLTVETFVDYHKQYRENIRKEFTFGK